MSRPLWISEEDVCRVLDIRSAIEALRDGLVFEAAGRARNMPKAHLAWDGNGLHTIGAIMPQQGLVAVKSWTHTGGGATPLCILWDAQTGELRAVIEAFALGQLRTGGVSGLATDLLADPAADELALCGTGRQALPQVAAVACVRTLSRVRVYGRDAERRESCALRVRHELDLFAEDFSEVEAAVHGAPILTLVTRAREPFLAADYVGEGAHVNAVGAITPERAEFDPELLDRCTVVASDSPDQARELSAELRARYGDDEASWATVETLSALVSAGFSRPADADVTLFKSMGTGLSDLCLARIILEDAEKGGIGRALEAPRRAIPRLSPIRSAR